MFSILGHGLSGDRKMKSKVIHEQEAQMQMKEVSCRVRSGEHEGRASGLSELGRPAQRH